VLLLLGSWEKLPVGAVGLPAVVFILDAAAYTLEHIG
jgi:hypothetical protein